MRTTRIAGALAGIALAALALTACNSGTPGAEPGTGGATGDAGDGSTSGNPWTVATDVTLDGSPTFEKMTDADKVVIGVKNDQPGLGYEDAATGTRSGFDIDIARWIAASLGFDEDKIEYQTIPSANREQAIVNGDIDYYVGTYSITDKRKEQIDFAGPYFITGQGLLVAKDNTDINGPDDLAGKIVCSVTGSTPLQRIRDEYNPGDTVEYDTYSQCVEQLKAGSVDAITTDEAILAGYSNFWEGEFKLVEMTYLKDACVKDALKTAGSPFSTERYGVGLALDDTASQNAVNTALDAMLAPSVDGESAWNAALREALGNPYVDEIIARADRIAGAQDRAKIARIAQPLRHQPDRRRRAVEPIERRLELHEDADNRLRIVLARQFGEDRGRCLDRFAAAPLDRTNERQYQRMCRAGGGEEQELRHAPRLARLCQDAQALG